MEDDKNARNIDGAVPVLLAAFVYTIVPRGFGLREFFDRIRASYQSVYQLVWLRVCGPEPVGVFLFHPAISHFPFEDDPRRSTETV